MKRKKTRKISLSRETLRALDDDRHLHQVAGGATQLADTCGCATEAYTNCLACPTVRCTIRTCPP